MLAQSSVINRKFVGTKPPAEFSIELKKASLSLQQLLQPQLRFDVCAVALIELPDNDRNSIRCDARVKGCTACELRHRVLLYEFTHSSQNFGCRRLIHHGVAALGYSRLTRSISVSDERRPIAARSTLRSDPSAKA